MARFLHLILILAILLQTAPVAALQGLRARPEWHDPAYYKGGHKIRYAGGLNLYAYAEADPINASDPDGLQPVNPWTGRLVYTVGKRVVQDPRFKGALSQLVPNEVWAGLGMGTAGIGYAGYSFTRGSARNLPDVLPGADTLQIPTGPRTTFRSINLNPSDARRIQRVATQTNQRIILFGSRVKGTAGPGSDYDYILSGNSRARSRAMNMLPRGEMGGQILPSGRDSGFDVFQDSNPNARGYRQLPASEPGVYFYP